MFNHFMHHFFVAVDGQVITIGDYISLRHTKTLLGAGAIEFAGFIRFDFAQRTACKPLG